MKKIAVSLVLLCALSVQAQELDSADIFAKDVEAMNNIPQLIELARETQDKEQYSRTEVVLQRLIKLRPYNPDFKFSLVKAFAQQNKKSEAYNALIEMQKAGLSYPIGDLEGFENIKDTGVFGYIEENMESNAAAFGEGTPAFEVSHHYSGMLFENLAYDPKGQRFLLGSIRAGSVYEYSEEGGFKEFIKPADPKTGPWGVVDLVIDDQADVLWTSSATMPHYNGTNQSNFGLAMISMYKLSTGELLNNFAMPSSNQPLLFSALHLSQGQSLYFINAFNSQVFKISQGSDVVEPVVALNGLSSIKAITSNADESILYVSDYEQGIYLVNMKTKQLVPLIRKPFGFFAGINDLFYDGGDLVAIQSGVKPARVMRFVLHKDLLLKNMFPIEASNPAFKTLGNGTLVGEHIYYAANSQWEKVDALGRLLPEQSWEPLTIIKSPTKYRMDEHMERQQKMEEIKKKRGLK